jgi:hypothetical protein
MNAAEHLLELILNDLPPNKNWLNPDWEKAARKIIAEAREIENNQNKTPRTDREFSRHKFFSGEGVDIPFVDFARTTEVLTDNAILLSCIEKAIDILDGQEEPIDWADQSQPELLRKISEVVTRNPHAKQRARAMRAETNYNKMKKCLELIYNDGRGSEVFPAQEGDHPECSWVVRFNMVKKLLGK